LRENLDFSPIDVNNLADSSRQSAWLPHGAHAAAYKDR
jgi:hypothetical protein